MSHNATGNVYVMQGIEGNRTDGVNLTNATNSTEEVNETQSIFQEYFGYFQQYSELGTAFIWNLNAASVGQISGNFSICQGNLSVFYNSSTIVYEEYADQYYAEAGYSTYYILQSVDPIIFSCYYSLFEYYIALQIYQETGKDIKKLGYNFAHNLGNIYDMTEEGIIRSIDFMDVYQDPEYWARMGTIIGSDFQNIFEDPVNYYPYGEDPNEDLERF